MGSQKKSFMFWKNLLYYQKYVICLHKMYFSNQQTAASNQISKNYNYFVYMWSKNWSHIYKMDTNVHNTCKEQE